MASIRRILFASDFSKASRKAFATAVTMAKGSRATLTVLHVIAPLVPISPDQYIGPETWQQLDEEAHRWAKRQVAVRVNKAKKQGVRVVGLIAEGNPAQQVVRIANSKRFDLVIIGTHGRTGLAKFFLGSVAGRVVATASCPVLTVRGT